MVDLSLVQSGRVGSNRGPTGHRDLTHSADGIARYRWGGLVSRSERPEAVNAPAAGEFVSYELLARTALV